MGSREGAMLSVCVCTERRPHPCACDHTYRLLSLRIPHLLILHLTSFLWLVQVLPRTTSSGRVVAAASRGEEGNLLERGRVRGVVWDDARGVCVASEVEAAAVEEDARLVLRHAWSWALHEYY